jgi:hypothetical protein
MRLRIKLILWSTCAAAVLVSISAHAAITYIGNGSMPDLMQDWGPAQKNKAICMAAAEADIMWYWDQNGYSGLVNHQNAANPNASWEQDGKALVYLMANYNYGLDPVTNNLSNKGQATPLAAIAKYIKTQNKYDGQIVNNQPVNGLVVDYYQAGNATYANWTAGINANGVLLGGLSWTDTAGKSIAQHAMVSAGVDSDNNNLIVTHGWDSHAGAPAPSQAPPYANPPPFINQYPMNVNANGKAVIPNPGDGSVDLFGGAKYGAATGMTLFEFYNIHPKAKAKVKMKAKAGAGLDYNYDSDVENESFAPIYQYVQEAETPIDAATAPPGWTAVPWNYTNTPDVTALPYESAQPPYENDPLQPIPPQTLNGILYYTTSNPILPGSDLDGFSFDSSLAFEGMAEDSMSVVSDGVSSWINTSTTGLTSEALFPTLTVPEPGAFAVLLAAASVLLMRRSSGTKT